MLCVKEELRVMMEGLGFIYLSMKVTKSFNYQSEGL